MEPEAFAAHDPLDAKGRRGEELRRSRRRSKFLLQTEISKNEIRRRNPLRFLPIVQIRVTELSDGFSVPFAACSSKADERRSVKSARLPQNSQANFKSFPALRQARGHLLPQTPGSCRPRGHVSSRTQISGLGVPICGFSCQKTLQDFTRLRSFASGIRSPFPASFCTRFRSSGSRVRGPCPAAFRRDFLQHQARTRSGVRRQPHPGLHLLKLRHVGGKRLSHSL